MHIGTALSTLYGSFENFLGQLNSEQQELCADDPRMVLPSRKYPADVAATTVFWTDEGIAAGGLVARPERRKPWMDNVTSFSDVVRLRNACTEQEGMAMLKDAIYYVVGCLADAPTNVQWEMSFYKPVNSQEFADKVVAHGEDHLKKVQIAVLKTEVGLPLHEDTDD